ncbi:MAG: DUF2975 domain-containing protein [Clostridia bacterium]|nr:DUF2975 domain-containing protein [Clostridia bacterium]
MENNKALKLCLLLTNIFFGILIVFTVALPFMVTWYVETMRRSASLAATILVTCYPCVPFVAAILVFLKKLLKNAASDRLFSVDSQTYLKRIAVCSIIIAAITFVAGKFYLPFLIVGATFAFLSLLIFSLKNIFASVKSE